MNVRTYLPLFRDIAGTTAVRVYSTSLSIVALVLTARWLGPHGRGVAVVVTTWTTLVSSIGYLSLGQVCVHRAATATDLKWVGPAAGALALVASVATLLGWAVAALLWAVARERLFSGVPAAALALGFLALPFLIWEQYGSALLSVIGRLRTYNMNQLAGRTAGFLVLVVTIRILGYGIYGFILGFLVGQVIASGAGIAIIFRHVGGRLDEGIRTVGDLVRDGLKIHLNAIGVLLFSGADVVMLEYFRGPTETGIFQLPMQLFLAMLLLPQSAQLTLQARVALKDKAEFWREHRLVIAWVVVIMTVAAAILWLTAPLAVTLIAGDRFEASVPIFRILMAGVPIACFNTLMTIQWIIRGYFLQASLITLTTGLLNCALNLFLIPRFGGEGAALATVIGVCAIPLVANSWLALRAAAEARRKAGAHA